MLNKKIFMVAGISTAIIFGLSLVLFPIDDINKQELPYLNNYSGYLEGKKHPPAQLMSSVTYGTQSPDVESLKLRSEYDVKISTSLPENVEPKFLLSTGTIEDKYGLTTIVYGHESIEYPNTSEMTTTDVFDSYGIMVLYYEKGKDFDSDKWIENYLEQVTHTELVFVNGIKAIGFSGNPEEGLHSTLLFHDMGTRIHIGSVAYTLPELIKLAETI